MPWVYAVNLKGPNRSVEIYSIQENYGKARKVAKKVARYLDLGIQDESSGKKVVHAAGAVDESVRERALRTGEAIEIPHQPRNSRTTYRLEMDRFVINFPPAGDGLAENFAFGVMLGLISLFFVGALANGEGICAGILLIVILIIFSMFVTRRIWPTWFQLTVTPRYIQMNAVKPVGEKSMTIPEKELQELEIVGSTIMARSDRSTILIGSSLSRGELEWIYKIIKYILVHEIIPAVPGPKTGRKRTCSSCGERADFIREYSRWYCYDCEEYL